MSLAILLLGCFVYPAAPLEGPAEGFVDAATLARGLQVELRYLKDWNFLGRPVRGYEANRCYLTRPAATALAKVQAELVERKRSLLVFDCYRPQRAVDDFVAWAKDLKDQKMKNFFYPDEAKEKLFAREYIASKSGHSRGSTVDLTIVLKTGGPFTELAADCRAPKNIAATGQLDMGTSYDCFDVAANTANLNVGAEARANRQLLKTLMEKHGFQNYAKEWWHYTLRDEPFPDRYFDFPVR